MMKPIAHGRESDIFDIQHNKVLKLYSSDFPKERIHQELEKALKIWESQKLPVPQPIKETISNGRNGIIYEKIEGIALIDLFQQKPWLYLSYLPTITNTHREIHKVQVSGLPTQQEEFESLIQKSERIPEADKDILIGILNKEHTPVLCHGDFHHGNLIQDNEDKIHIIDWMDAFVGAYQLDVALTAVNASISTAPDHIPYVYRKSYDILKTVFALDKRYLKFYGIENIDEYMFLAAAIHMAKFDGDYRRVHLAYYQKLRNIPLKPAK